MKKPLALRTFQIGSPAKHDAGLRIGVTRRPPRGIPRAHWQSGCYFDVWFPVLAPSATLLKWVHAQNLDDPAKRRAFFNRYEREMLGRLESRQAIHLLAAVAARTPVSLGCFCRDENRCHRSRLRRLIERAAATP
jgi:uncharacterized protein YeaO (DUF488 family)